MDLPAYVWATRYRDPDADPAETGIADSWRRVATAAAAAERDPSHWRDRFLEILGAYRFLPAGRILAGAGTRRRVTLFNCFVLGPIEDSIEGIFEALKEGALTMQQGGGVGYDFSTLRPAGEPADAAGTTASGPLSFMHVWDAMCATVQSTGARRGAMMATLACDHPDIEAFVAAKRMPGVLTRFNLSVLVTDAFLRAVDADADWALGFPAPAGGRQVARRVRARALWDSIVRNAYDCAEPGVIFIDRVRAQDNLGYAETISATNPCGEIPLPPYGACDLGSLNLTGFVQSPFTAQARLDFTALAATASVATRMLDNVYDVSGYPLPEQAQTARASRRLGLGLTGLADALIMLGVRYDAPEARGLAAEAMRTIKEAAYAASIALAREKGPFPLFDRERYAAAPFVRSLPSDLQEALARGGIRNSHLTAIAPAGTISLVAGNVASGLEPVFSLAYSRKVRQPDGALVATPVECYALTRFRERHAEAALPPAFVTVAEVTPTDQIAMQAALQAHVDNAIAKTVNVPADIDPDAFASIYRCAYDSGLKGCTVFRPNAVTGAVLTPSPTVARCCEIG